MNQLKVVIRMRTFKYTSPTVGNFNLNTPVTFFEYAPKTGPDPGEDEKRVLFECFANAYAPSSKDVQILDSKGTDVTKSVTIRIRDTAGEYVPTNKQYFELNDPYFSTERYQIQTVSTDPEDRNYIKVIGSTSL